MLVLVSIDVLMELGRPDVEVLVGDHEVSLVIRHDEVDAEWRPLPEKSVVVWVAGQRRGNQAVFDAANPVVRVTQDGRPIEDEVQLDAYRQEARFLVEAVQELRPR